MVRQHMKRDFNGKYVLYSLHDNHTLQEGEGIFDTLKNVGTKIATKLTGKAAKEIAKKAATKAFEKGAEQIGEKTGQLIDEKIYDKFSKQSDKMPQVTAAEAAVQHEITPEKIGNWKEDKADAAAIINGGFSMINDVKVDFESTRVVDLPRANHVANMKNLTEFTKEYSEDLGPRQFHYLDTATGAVTQKYDALTVTIAAGGGTVTPIPKDNTNYNEGFAKRKVLLAAGAKNNIHLPLNRFGFFESLEEQLAPNAKVTIEVTLEKDANVLFRTNAAGAGRYIVTKFLLWVPRIRLTEPGKKIYLDDFLKPKRWSYLKETAVFSKPLRQESGIWNLTTAIKSTRHVFIWVLNAAKFNSQEQNMFLFNTYNIAGNARYLTNAQLHVENGDSYPFQKLNPKGEITRAWTNLLDYVKFLNGNLFGPTINLKRFQDLYGILYFDLTKQDPGLRSAKTSLDFEFSLNDAPNADYYFYALILSEEEIANQRRKLAKAFNEKSPITLRLSHNELTGSDEMMLTKTQINRIHKAINGGKGVDLKIRKTQITKVAQKGGSLFSSLLALGTKLLPKAMNLATKALPGLATGALSSLGNFATDKILGAGQSGGLIIPHSKIPQLLPFENRLSEKQKRDIAIALQSGGDLKMKPTKSQSGGFLGTLLASIGVPILLKALTGSGLQNRPAVRGRGMQNRPIWFPPQFDGPIPTIGRGVKKKWEKKVERTRSVAGKKLSLQRSTTTGGHTVKRPPFKNIPITNIDIQNWVEYLKIPNFGGVISRDRIKDCKTGHSFVINLNESYESGSHWVVIFFGSDLILYFDSFGLHPPQEIVTLSNKHKVNYVFNNTHYQSLTSVLCGYYCLFFLNETSKRLKPKYTQQSLYSVFNDVTEPLSYSNTFSNECFIINYFKTV
ncbi:hypothetical protein AWC38_SpisGene21072 [Stylophora pistillata]|uniref:Uncharacterized protein n=1 Tax=Stylophora pistillata TaxID=50429 RepID=A0A2B4REE2_STYPI|nr:hypothetical protein AWC38_SpisGene21072 [Stylophora pistillata]